MRYVVLVTLAAAAALVSSAPANAQAVEELTVTGHLNASRLQSLSETVSFADLDLNRYGDRQELLLRVNNAARHVCTTLNQETRSPANLGHSCQDNAVRGAMDQVRYAFADARDRAYADTYGAPASATVPDTDYRDPR
jgi:UrcA family protein